jgi:hypothetical protein
MLLEKIHPTRLTNEPAFHSPGCAPRVRIKILFWLTEKQFLPHEGLTNASSSVLDQLSRPLFVKARRVTARNETRLCDRAMGIKLAKDETLCSQKHPNHQSSASHALPDIMPVSRMNTLIPVPIKTIVAKSRRPPLTPYHVNPVVAPHRRPAVAFTSRLWPACGHSAATSEESQGLRSLPPSDAHVRVKSPEFFICFQNIHVMIGKSMN